MPLSDLPSTSLFTDSMVPHLAACVVGLVFLHTVQTSQGMLAGGETLQSVVVVDVICLLAELAFLVVIEFIVVSSA